MIDNKRKLLLSKKRRQKLGQTSIEYLATYGWALLIITVAVSLLYILILAPSISAPVLCTFNSGATCHDIVLGSNSVAAVTALVISNSQPYPISNPTFVINSNGQGNVTGTCSPSFVLPGGSMVCSATLPSAYSQGAYVTSAIYVKAKVCATGTSVSTCGGGTTQTLSGSASTHVQQPLTYPLITISLAVQNSTQGANGALDPLTVTVMLSGHPYEGASVNLTENQSFPQISSLKVNTDSNGNAVSYISSQTAGTVLVYANFSGFSANVPVSFVSTLTITFTAIYKYVAPPGTILTVDNVPYTAAQLPINVTITPHTRHTYSYTPSFTWNGINVANPVSVGCGTSASNGIILATYNCSVYAYYSTYFQLSEQADCSGGSGCASSLGLVPAESSGAPAGYFSVNTPVTISETPAGLWTFLGWSGVGAGAYTGPLSSNTVVMPPFPITEIASYIPTTTTASTTASTSITTTVTSIVTTTATTTVTTTELLCTTYDYYYCCQGSGQECVYSCGNNQVTPYCGDVGTCDQCNNGITGYTINPPTSSPTTPPVKSVSGGKGSSDQQACVVFQTPTYTDGSSIPAGELSTFGRVVGYAYNPSAPSWSTCGIPGGSQVTLAFTGYNYRLTQFEYWDVGGSLQTSNTITVPTQGNIYVTALFWPVVDVFACTDGQLYGPVAATHNGPIPLGSNLYCNSPGYASIGNSNPYEGVPPGGTVGLTAGGSGGICNPQSSSTSTCFVGWGMVDANGDTWNVPCDLTVGAAAAFGSPNNGGPADVVTNIEATAYWCNPGDAPTQQGNSWCASAIQNCWNHR